MNANVEQEPRVDLVFHGQVLAGFDPEQVKRAIGDFFKLDDLRRDRMFSGTPHVVKRGLTPADASRYVALFEKLGGRLHSQGSAAPAGVRTPEPAAGAARPLQPSPPSPPPPPAARAALTLAPVEAAVARPGQARPAPGNSGRSRPAPMASEPLVVVDEPPSVFGVGLSGRLARRPYGAAALFGWAAIRWSLLGLAQHPHPGVVALIGLALLAAALWTFRLTVLRLHDVGLSGWWVLLGAVPIMGTVAGILLSLVPGSSNDNRFGAVPDPGNPVLRLVVMVAVLCIGAGFRHGLLPGSGGAGLGAPVEQPALQAQGAAAAPTDEELSAVLKTAQARRDFREAYWPAKGHKAFASSDGGAWGWSADAATAVSAQEQALARCEKARDAYSGECRPLHVDADWAD